MKDELKRVYQDVNDWLKYAESKNAALVVANIAILFGLLQILNSFNSSSYYFYFQWYTCSVVLALLISTGFCLLSFVPQFSNAWFFKPSSTANKNLLFYGDIASLDHEEFLEQFRGFMKCTAEEISDFEKALARQIVGNSRIALRKYNVFLIAVWFTVAALITPLGAFIFVCIECIFEKG